MSHCISYFLYHCNHPLIKFTDELHGEVKQTRERTRNNIKGSREARSIGRKSAKKVGITTNNSLGIITFNFRPKLKYTVKSWQNRRVGGNAVHKELESLNGVRYSIHGGQTVVTVASCTSTSLLAFHLQVSSKLALLPRKFLFPGSNTQKAQEVQQQTTKLEFKQ